MADNINESAEVTLGVGLSDKKLKKDIKKIEKDLRKLSEVEINARIASSKEKAGRYYENYKQRLAIGQANASDRAVKAQENIQKRLQAELDFRKKEQSQSKRITNTNELLKAYKQVLEGGNLNKETVNSLAKKVLGLKTLPFFGKLDQDLFTDVSSLIEKTQTGFASEDAAKAERNRKIAEDWNKLIGEQLSKSDELKIRYQQLRDTLEELGEEYKKIREGGGEVSKDLLDRVQKTTKEIKSIQQQMKPSFIQKLFSTFKRIGFYRLARDFYRIIINSFKEGIQLFASFDKHANETMSNLTGSFTIIKASISSILLTIVDMFVPAIRDIASGFADVANQISRASALLRGETEYTKINAEYMKAYGDAAKQALLSFDKFETLSGNDNSGLFSTEKIEGVDEKTKAWADTLKSIKTVVDIVWAIIKEIGSTLKNIWENAIRPNLSSILLFVSQLINFFGWIVLGLAKIASWAGENVKLFRALVIFGAGLATIIGAMTGNIGLAVKAGVVLAMVSLYDPNTSASSINTSLGIPSTATTQTNSGISDVVNESLATNSELNSGNSTVVINLDGQKIAQTNITKSLADEMNRRNLKLNIN